MSQRFFLPKHVINKTWSPVFIRKFKPYVQNGVESRWAEEFTTIITPQTPIPEYVPMKPRHSQAEITIPKAPSPAVPKAEPPSTSTALVPAVPGAAPPPPPGIMRGKSSGSLHSDDMNVEARWALLDIQNKPFDVDLQLS